MRNTGKIRFLLLLPVSGKPDIKVYRLKLGKITMAIGQVSAETADAKQIFDLLFINGALVF